RTLGPSAMHRLVAVVLSGPKVAKRKRKTCGTATLWGGTTRYQANGCCETTSKTRNSEGLPAALVQSRHTLHDLFQLCWLWAGQVTLKAVIELAHPRGVVRGGHGAGYYRTVHLVAVGQDVFLLGLGPVLERLGYLIEIEHGVIGH